MCQVGAGQSWRAHLIWQPGSASSCSVPASWPESSGIHPAADKGESTVAAAVGERAHARREQLGQNCLGVYTLDACSEARLNFSFC